MKLTILMMNTFTRKRELLAVALFGNTTSNNRPVVCVASAAYHVEEFIALKNELEKIRKIPTVIVIPLPKNKHFFARNHHKRRFDDIRKYLISPYTPPFEIHNLIARCIALVVKNDWSGVSKKIISYARHSHVPVIGWVEGAVNFLGHDAKIQQEYYKTVDHVLCLGQYDVNMLVRPNTTIVGSQRLWELWRSPVIPNPQFITVNSNFAYSHKKGRVKWLHSVASAINKTQLQWALSRHPAESGIVFPYRASNKKASELLAQSTHLISKQSTLCYEALVRGVALYYHNSIGEVAPRFTHPNSAFTVTTNTNELASALSIPPPKPRLVRQNASNFLDLHLSLENEEPPTKRAANIIYDLCI